MITLHITDEQAKVIRAYVAQSQPFLVNLDTKLPQWFTAQSIIAQIDRKLSG